jgi:DNA-binding MarR family transcriptional regulator
MNETAWTHSKRIQNPALPLKSSPEGTSTPSVVVGTPADPNRKPLSGRMEGNLMQEHPTTNGEIPGLKELAEFRFHLRQFLAFSEIASERYGVQAQQYQLLQVIGAVPLDQPASVSYLAERMVLRHNSTVELVDRAERAGLVRRHSDERDLRRSLVRLTPQGEEILRHLVAEHRAELARHEEEIVQTLRAVNHAAQARFPQGTA